MKKSFFKFLFLIAFVFCGMSVFADNWYVCLGSFRNKKYAQERMEAFAGTEIPVFISESVTKSGSLLYRVLYCKPYVDIKDAQMELSELRNDPIIKKLGLTDLWCCKTDGNSNVQTVYVEKIVEVIKEVPVEVVKIVEVVKEVPVESKNNPKEVVEFDNSLDEESNCIETEDEKTLTEKEENPPEPETPVVSEEPSKAEPEISDDLASELDYVDDEDENKVVPKASASEDEIVYDEARTVVIKDSDTGDVVPNVTVMVDDDLSLLTDENGKIVLPDEVEDGDHKISVNKGDDYVETNVAITISEAEISSGSNISIPKSVDYERIKIVLDWSRDSIDLDAHMKSGWRHVYYAHRKSKNIRLDHDERKGNGVETMTIEGLESDDTYEYYVYDYTNNGKMSSKALSFSKAHVSVYKNNTFIKEFNITSNQVGVKWHVFNIKNNGDIEFINEISN